MPLFHLIYVSSATCEFSSTDLVALLERSRRNNTSVNISGMLLYRDGNFMQVLEGEENDVARVHAKIALDPRHRGLITLLHRPIEQRSFEEWSMAFRNLNSADLRELPGYSEFLNDDWFGEPLKKNPDRAIKLLESFRQSPTR